MSIGVMYFESLFASIDNIFDTNNIDLYEWPILAISVFGIFVGALLILIIISKNRK